ncbi:MAG: hypothetical protein Q9M91_06600 [Candidatus Dojkabacteria bacterium]|nr:hypothetical protein [Candidatus Dojkabacteria bacterium]
MNEANLESLALDLGLPIKDEIRDNAFWKKFNERVNIDVKEWSDEKY